MKSAKMKTRSVMTPKVIMRTLMTTTTTKKKKKKQKKKKRKKKKMNKTATQKSKRMIIRHLKMNSLREKKIAILNHRLFR